MKAIAKHWLGWDRPLLHSTVDFLLAKYRKAHDWDLDNVTCVLPSSMAMRRLQELLAERANAEAVVLRPPTIITSGQLPEQLYEPRFPFASDLEQLLCWTKVLRQASVELLKPLLIEVPSASQMGPWVELAALLSSLHRELSSDLTLFDDVAKRLANDVSLADEAERWRVLAKIQRAYLDELHRADRWDIQTARRYAIDKKESKTTRDLIVIGAVDLYQAQRKFLEAVADRVTLLIGAPKSWHEGFDEFGTLHGYFWEHLPLELEAAQLVTRTTANEAADEVSRQLAYLDGRFSPQEVTIGVPDTTLVPLLKERLERVGITGRYGAGVNAGQTSPVRLLKAVNDYLAESSYEALASLVRLPAVFEMLRRSGSLPSDFIQRIDRYQQETLLGSLTANDWPKAAGIEVFEALVQAIEKWLKPLRMPPIALREWAEPLQTVFREVYDAHIVDLDSEEGASLVDACSAVATAVAHLGDLPGSLMMDSSLSEALAWIVRQIDKSTIPPLRNENAVELIGWLDLALDDAPVLLLTGVHDGTVPESVNADAFLPNQIRSELGLMDNTRRYARDSYSMHVHMRSRKHFRVVTNHQSVAGDPQTPSRLLLAVEPNQLSKRVMSLIKPPDVSSLPSVRGFIPPRPIQSNLPIPKPLDNAARTVVSLSPSDFQSYLTCPYRFYLKKILRLRTIDDRATELQANAFGTLIHDTLAKMADAEAAKMTDATELRVWLFYELNSLAAERYGKHPAPVIAVQLEQARQRLAAFAKKQVERTAEGWQIWGTEIEVGQDKPYLLQVLGQEPMPLVGRIDRIDFHPSTGRFAIWDYKTGDTTTDPLKAHWSRKGWKQLQLPLYIEMAKTLKIAGPVDVGYIILPRAVDKIDFKLADFSQAGPPDPLTLAAEIVMKIRDNQFWPPKYEGIGDWDDFKAVCQTNAARRWDEKLEKASTNASAFHSIEPVTSKNNPRARTASQKSGRGEEPTTGAVRINLIDVPPEDIAVPLDSTAGSAPHDWFDRKLIEASAGTGKTYNLAMRMIRLLFARQSPEGILATTFTRKAAGEILERVLSLLAEAVDSPDKLRELAKWLSPLKINRQSCLHHLSNLCSKLHRLRVNTLDGFYAQLARSFALELQLPPGWTLASEFEETHLREWAVSRMFEADDRTQLRSLISQLNRGEAKRGIRQDILQTIDSGYQLFRLTTRDAWSNLHVPKEPTQAALQSAMNEVEASKMKHSSFAKARDKLVLGFLAEDWEEFFGNGLVKSYQGERTYYKVELPSSLISGLEVLIQMALSKELASRRAQSEAAYDLLANYDSQLEAVKRQQRLVTFSDVSYRLSRWFRQETKPATEPNDASTTTASNTIAKANYRLDSQIDHLLVDEFQDTSPTQWDILSPFAEAVVKASSDGEAASFFCVGDVKQAIYGWRGGVAELFEVIRHQLKDVRDDQLKVSYRSSPIVINFVNDVFKNLRKHTKLGHGEEAATLWVSTFPEHSTTKDLPGYIRIWNSEASGEKSGNGENDESDLEEPAVDDAILVRCIDDIAELNRSAPNVSIGILVRTNAELGSLIHRLRERGIEASQEGGNPLDDSAAVELILSLVHLADHPGDSIAEFHVKSSPFADLLARSTPNPNSQTLDAIAAERLAIDVRRRLDESGYGKTVSSLASRLASECNQRDQMRLDQLIQAAYTYDAIATLRHRDFVDYVRSNKVALSRPSPVRVMTIHQSKGLEFDAVFLPGMCRPFISRTPVFLTSQSDPTQPPKSVMRYIGGKIQPFLGEEWQAAFKQHHLRAYSEAYSLFYVALTRARQAVYFYAQPTKNPVQRWDSLLQSVFVDESERAASAKIVYEAGDRRWFARQAAVEPQSTVRESVAAPAIELNMKRAAESNFVRQREGLKPSAAHEGRKMPVKQLFENNESAGAVIGTVVHRWFEEIVWLEDFRWDRKRMHSLALQTLTPEQMPLIKLSDCLAEMEGFLAYRSVIESLSRNRYAGWKTQDGRSLRLAVTNERPLLKLIDGKLLRGTIDRLVLGFDGDRAVRGEVLDYKTDAVNKKLSVDAWCQDRIDHHGPQLQLYRRVLCEQFQIDEGQIALTLILLYADRLIAVS